MLGTSWTVQAWADCPLGNDAAANLSLTVFTVPMVWLLMTVLLAVIHLRLRATTDAGEWPFRAFVLVLAALVLMVLYRGGMSSPLPIEPGGTCMEGWPVFPFTGKPGPGPS
ncbi:hypothetical protein ACWGB8_17715 [Kitasatospora sp. NPDC054939]